MSTIEFLIKNNIISNDNDTYFSLDNGYMLDIIKTCKLLFGTEHIPVTVSLLELEINNIIVEIEQKYYIPIDKFDIFIQKVGNLFNQQNNYILINYYNIYNYKLTNFNKDLSIWWTNIKEFLNKKNSKNYDIVKNIFGQKLFNGILTEYNNNTWTIKFKTYSSTYVLTFGYKDMDINNYVNIKNCNFKKLVKDIIKEILLSNPDKYIIENLTKVTEVNHLHNYFYIHIKIKMILLFQFHS